MIGFIRFLQLSMSALGIQVRFQRAVPNIYRHDDTSNTVGIEEVNIVLVGLKLKSRPIKTSILSDVKTLYGSHFLLGCCCLHVSSSTIRSELYFNNARFSGPRIALSSAKPVNLHRFYVLEYWVKRNPRRFTVLF